MYPIIKNVVLVFLCFSSCIGKAQKVSDIQNLQGENITINALETFVDSAMKAFQIPGLSLAIINKGKVVYHTTKGWSDKSSEQAITDKTIFEAASLSKPLFAYFVMKFVEAGKLHLDTPLYQYYPYPILETDVRYQQITARMVLSHTTGFPNWRSDYPENKLFIQFDPGTSFHYSGEGYQYLTKTLAHILDTDAIGLEKVFQDSVAKPLDLKYTKYIQDAYNLRHKAVPHQDGKKISPKGKEVDFGAAYSVHTEALDFSKWIIALLNEEGLSASGFEQLFEDQVEVPEEEQMVSSWTLGFSKLETPYGNVYTHGGNNPGFTSAFGFHREQKWGIIYFTNANQVSDFGLELFYFLHPNF